MLVEGTEDIAYIKAHILRLGLMDRFWALGGHFIPAHAKSRMVKPLAILNAIGIPHYCLFDADGDCANPKARPMQESDNQAQYTLMGIAGAVPFPDEAHWGDGFTVWPTNHTKVIEADFGKDAWFMTHGVVRVVHGQPADIQKTAHFIPEYLEATWAGGRGSPTGERLALAILEDSERKVGKYKSGRS